MIITIFKRYSHLQAFNSNAASKSCIVILKVRGILTTTQNTLENYDGVANTKHKTPTRRKGYQKAVH
eukprot:m.8568 g.8568  ORF g.8568 m.8568 type:complete len:67 (-) comp3923_c0_seq1:188-388(-)